jgi:hypothetical protein
MGLNVLFFAHPPGKGGNVADDSLRALCDVDVLDSHPLLAPVR